MIVISDNVSKREQSEEDTHISVFTIVRFRQDIKVDRIESQKVIHTELTEGCHGTISWSSLCIYNCCSLIYFNCQIMQYHAIDAGKSRCFVTVSNWYEYLIRSFRKFPPPWSPTMDADANTIRIHHRTRYQAWLESIVLASTTEREELRTYVRQTMYFLSTLCVYIIPWVSLLRPLSMTDEWRHQTSTIFIFSVYPPSTKSCHLLGLQ